jgi:DNA repair protein RadD
LFAPVVKAGKAGGGEGGMKCDCPDCAYENNFTANPLYLAYGKDDAGYILDLDGRQVMSDFGPIPGHYGRRCMGLVQAGKRGEYERCSYRWTFKECPHCAAENDIAARYCIACKGEIVDPNEKLVADFKALKRDPTRIQTDKVLSMSCVPGVSKNGNYTIRVEFVTPYRQFAIWLLPESTVLSINNKYQKWAIATDSGHDVPSTVTYAKNAETGFFEIKSYNWPADEMPNVDPEPEWNPFEEAEQHAAE